MCGIYGYVGKGNPLNKCLKALKFLEYRGYDSSGVVGNEGNKLICYKEKGKLSDLEKRLENKLHSFQSSIGHTRWATHGAPSALNAHPHLDTSNSVAIVHNGIIENHRDLRQMLEKEGIKFKTDTDSEVIAQLIAHLYKGDLMRAVYDAKTLMKGFWALAVLHKDHPLEIVATRLENPIVIAMSKEKQGAYVASDPHALQEEGLEFHFLKNHQIAKISPDGIDLVDKDYRSVPFSAQKMGLPKIEMDKGDFPHFMLKEIYDQPSSVQMAIENRLDLDRGLIKFENFLLSDQELASFQNILIMGCGTSWHAGCIAALQMQELAKISAQSVIASEYRYSSMAIPPNTLVIALSQSGETFDTIAAVKKAKKEGAKILALSNVIESTLMRKADYTIPLRAGPEISVCSTKAFTCQLAILTLLSIKVALVRNMAKDKMANLLSEIATLPKMIYQVLAQREKISLLAKKYAQYTHFAFIGRQYMFPTACESALKLKEISYLYATAYPSGELKHGPIALIDQFFPVIGLCGNAHTLSKMVSNLAEIHARAGPILAFAPKGYTEIEGIADDIIPLPIISDLLAPILYCVATQLFAYSIACERDTDIDQPRNLAKSVTVE